MKHPNSIYDKEFIINICKLLENGYKNKQILEILNIKKESRDYNKIKILISNIKSRKLWKSISKDYKWNKEKK